MGRIVRQEMHTELCLEQQRLLRSMRWKDKIKVDLRQTSFEDRRLMVLAQDRVKWRSLELAESNLGFCYNSSSTLRPRMADLER